MVSDDDLKGVEHCVNVDRRRSGFEPGADLGLRDLVGHRSASSDQAAKLVDANGVRRPGAVRVESVNLIEGFGQLRGGRHTQGVELKRELLADRPAVVQPCVHFLDDLLQVVFHRDQDLTLCELTHVFIVRPASTPCDSTPDIALIGIDNSSTAPAEAKPDASETVWIPRRESVADQRKQPLKGTERERVRERETAKQGRVLVGAGLR